MSTLDRFLAAGAVIILGLWWDAARTGKSFSLKLSGFAKS